MAFISSYLNDKNNYRIIKDIFDETLRQYKERSTIINELAPIKTYTSFDFITLISNKSVPAARIVAPGQNIPLTQAGQFRELRGELAKLVVKQEWTEIIQRKLYQAIQTSELTGIPVRDLYDSSTGDVRAMGTGGDLVRKIFQDHKDMAFAIYDKLDAMFWEGIVYGHVTTEAIDQLTGVNFQIDYRNPAATYNHFPNALVATGNTANPELNMWTDRENANGLLNLELALDTYRQTNGCSPDYLLMSLPTYRNLLNMQSTKDAVNQVRGSMSVGTVSNQMLSEILQDRFLPPVTIIDDRFKGYDYMEENGRRVEKLVDNKRFLPEGYFVFGKKSMGERAIGPTLESATNALENGNGIPKASVGLSYMTWEEKKSPPIDATQVTAAALPIIIQDKYLYSQKVH